MKIKRKEVVPLFLLIIFHIAELLMEEIAIFKYCDELYAVFFFVIISVLCIQGRLAEKARITYYIIFGCLVIFFIGLFGNLIWGVQDSKIAIILDIVANFKYPICCLGYALMLEQDTAKLIIRRFRVPAYSFMVIGFICSILSLFVDIGMRGQKRFGIWGFNFLYTYAHQYSLVLLFCLLIIANTVRQKRYYWIFYFMFAVQMILTTKGTSIMALAAGTCVLYFMRGNRTFKLRNLIPIAVLIPVFGMYQIKTYFMNSTAPRAILFRYAFYNLKSFFPLGSGFGTYGSDMAAKYYSRLYVEYGFENNWALARGSNFLNDNYWPMIIGQFGLVGTMAVVFLIAVLYFRIQKVSCNNIVKATMLISLGYILFASAGTTIFTTSSTILMSLGIILTIRSYSTEQKE